MEFSQIHYDRHTICWGHGNNLVGPQLLARIQLREPTKKEDKEEGKEEKKNPFKVFCSKGQYELQKKNKVL